MPSTPSSSLSPSFSHTQPTSPPPSSPSISIPSRDANAIVHVNVNVNATHDLPLPPPSAPISSACAACKYQRRKCGPQCMLAPYFPPDRQSDFQNAHKLFGVSNIVKKLRMLSSPTERQNAVDTMVYEANMHAINPAGGCCKIIKELQEKHQLLLQELTELQPYLNYYRANPCNLETNLQEQPYPDQMQSSFVSLDDINPSQNKLQNQAHQQRLQYNYFYFDSDQINWTNNNNSEVGSHDITCNYVNNDHNNHNEEEQEQDRDEIRPFIDIIPICSDNEEGEEQLVCKSSVDMTFLNSALDTSTQCSLGLGSHF